MQAAAKPHALLPDMNVPAVHLNSCAIQEAGVLELTQLSLTSSVERSVALDAMARFRKEYAHAANPNTLLTVTTLEQSCKVHSILDAVTGKNKPTDDQVMAVTGIYNSFACLEDQMQTKLVGLTVVALPSMLVAMSDKRAAVAGFDTVIKAAGAQPQLSKHKGKLLLGLWHVYQSLLPGPLFRCACPLLGSWSHFPQTSNPSNSPYAGACSMVTPTSSAS